MGSISVKSNALSSVISVSLLNVSSWNVVFVEVVVIGLTVVVVCVAFSIVVSVVSGIFVDIVGFTRWHLPRHIC